MYSGQLVFTQPMEHLPHHTFRCCVQRYPSKYPTKTFSHLDQFLCMDFALSLIQTARTLYASDHFAVELGQAVYALDTTIIDLCLSVFLWARFRQTKAVVKMHTLLDLRGNIPIFIHISDDKMHEVNVLDVLIPEAGSFYSMDQGFTDFTRWFVLHQARAFFVTRAKANLLFRRVCSRSVDKSTGLRCDQTIALSAPKARKDYPQHLRRIKFYDAGHDKGLVFLTNNFDLPALAIAQLYRCRWQVELFFKWIKQHLRIKRFYGTTENAVKTQIWISITVYVLVAIVKKRRNIEASLYTILQILGLTLFEKTILDQILKNTEIRMTTQQNNNQLNLSN